MTSRISTARESLARLDAMIAALVDDRQRKWLSTYRDHWWSEVINDVDGVMATMSHGPIRYTFDGHPFMSSEDSMDSIKTHEDTRRMYEGVVSLGVRMAGPFDAERITFDDQGIVVHYILTTIYPGKFIPNHSEPVDPDGFYMLRWPNITMIRFDEQGLMMGEDIFNGAPILVKQVDASMIDDLVDGPLVAD